MSGAAPKRVGASGRRVDVIDPARGPELPIAGADGLARAIIWPGMGATLRSMHRVTLWPGGETVELGHPGEAVYYVRRGRGEVVDGSDRTAKPIEEGSMVHIEAGTGYRFRAGDDGLNLIGGPAPADRSMYEGIEGRG